MAAASCPRPCYLQFRYALIEDYAVAIRKGRSGTEVIGKQRHVLTSTPIVRGSNWALAHQFVFGPSFGRERDPNYNAGVYLRLAGLAVKWPKP